MNPSVQYIESKIDISEVSWAIHSSVVTNVILRHCSTLCSTESCSSTMSRSCQTSGGTFLHQGTRDCLLARPGGCPVGTRVGSLRG